MGLAARPGPKISVNNLEQSRPIVSVLLLAVGIAFVAAFLFRSTVSPPKELQTAPQNACEAVYPVLRHNGEFSHAPQRDAGEELNLILQQDDHVTRLNNFRLMLAQWVAEDREAALAYVRTMKIGPERTEGLLIVLKTIGQSDTVRAIALANEMVKDSEQAAIYNSLFATATANDMPSALRYFESVPQGAGRDNALLTITSKWAASDADNALKWANGLADEHERQSAIESSLDSVMRENPQRAMTLAQEYLSGEARDQLYSAAIRHLCELDPDAARDAFSRLDSEYQQPFTAAEVARALATKDMNSAIAWTDTLPEGSSRDAAVSFLARVTAQPGQ